MKHSTVRSHLSVLLPMLVLIVTAGVAEAQTRDDCSTPAPPGAGGSIGRSSPYFEFSPGAVDGGDRGSILIRGGLHLAARADVPIAGPWRARVEGAAARWRVERQTYDDNFQLIATDTVGHVKSRHIVGLVGRQGGRSPVCGYVLVGGGFYSLDYQGASVRSPGVALTAGVELPIGGRGAIQADVQLHLNNTRGRYPISSSTVPAASLSVGWLHRF